MAQSRMLKDKAQKKDTGTLKEDVKLGVPLGGQRKNIVIPPPHLRQIIQKAALLWYKYVGGTSEKRGKRLKRLEQALGRLQGEQKIDDYQSLIRGPSSQEGMRHKYQGFWDWTVGWNTIMEVQQCQR